METPIEEVLLALGKELRARSEDAANLRERLEQETESKRVLQSSYEVAISNKSAQLEEIKLELKGTKSTLATALKQLDSMRNSLAEAKAKITELETTLSEANSKIINQLDKVIDQISNKEPGLSNQDVAEKEEIDWYSHADNQSIEIITALLKEYKQ